MNVMEMMMIFAFVINIMLLFDHNNEYQTSRGQDENAAEEEESNSFGGQE